MPDETNPFLGRRGIRTLLAYPEMFAIQARAFLRISLNHKVRILAPMVTFAEEMLKARLAIQREAKTLGIKEIPPLGAMIETPAAALCAARIAECSDFISVGTNDLTQYTLAAGRENARVSDYFVEDHPSVLRLICTVINESGSDSISVCGELAGRQESLPRLLQCGVRVLSMAPPLIPAVKDALRRMSVAEGA